MGPLRLVNVFLVKLGELLMHEVASGFSKSCVVNVRQQKEPLTSPLERLGGEENRTQFPEGFDTLLRL